MRFRAVLATFTLLILSVTVIAATGSDIFINEVTPLTYLSNDKPGSIMPTVGNRRDIIAALRTAQSRQLQSLRALNRLPSVKSATPSIIAQKKELKLRQKFYDQVIFSVDTKWNDGAFKDFLEKEFLSRAQNDIDSDTTDSAADADPLWKFYTYLSVAIRDLPEPREDLVSFIQSYIEFSTLTKPKPPAEFVAQRAYSNGLVSQAANSIPQDEIGDGVERLVRKHGLEKPTKHASTANAPFAIELQLKMDMTPPAGAILPSLQHN